MAYAWRGAFTAHAVCGHGDVKRGCPSCIVPYRRPTTVEYWPLRGEARLRDFVWLHQGQLPPVRPGRRAPAIDPMFA